MKLRTFTAMMNAMASTICGHCETKSHMTPVWGKNMGHRSPSFQLAATCDHCHKLNIAFTEAPSLIGANSSTFDTAGADQAVLFSKGIGEPVDWYPRIGSAPEIEDVPQHIADAAKEAHSCASIGSYMASILMTRTVVEATAKEKGITDGTLYFKINVMREKGLIRPQIAEFAHALRHMGNDMAHGDLEDKPTDDDASDALELMTQVLNEVFQGPALLERRQARRLS